MDEGDNAFRLTCSHFLRLSSQSYTDGDLLNTAGFGQAAGAFAIATALTDMLTWMKAADAKTTASLEEAKASAMQAAEAAGAARVAMEGLRNAVDEDFPL